MAPSDSDSSSFHTVGPSIDERSEESVDEEEERQQRDVAGRRSTSEIYYRGDNGFNKKGLVCMCIGQTTDRGGPLIDLEQPPWSLEPSKTVKPNNKDLVMEVLRRQKVLASTSTRHDKRFNMRPKNKPREELLDWLGAFPIEDLLCRSFLSKEVSNVVEILEKAQAESQMFNEGAQTGAWVGAIPYLRLLHCITDLDQVRKAFLCRNDVMERPELDAQGTESAPPNSYDIIAEAWNDPTFNPWTRASSSHDLFRAPLKLHHSIVEAMIPADGLKVKNVLSTIRANLLRIIQNWEQSGQGDCGRLPDDDDDDSEEIPSNQTRNGMSSWGALNARQQHALDCRQNFLNGAHEWYLYFWEQADKYQLLSSCLQRLSDNVVTGDGGEVSRNPNLSNRKKKKRRTSLLDEDHADVDGGSALGQDKDISDLKGLLSNMVDNTKTDREEKATMAESERIAKITVAENERIAKITVAENERIAKVTVAENERIAKITVAETESVTKMRIFVMTQMAETEKEVDIAEEKFHQTKDIFYQNLADRKRKKLDELRESLDKYT